MLKIAITGGVGSGKSAAADIFHELGVPVIDADVYARKTTEPGTATYKTIIDYFGDEFLCEDGTINRAKLRRSIFADTDKKAWLESLLHPIILEAMFKAADAFQDKAYCIFVIPLLIETHNQNKFDRICVIDCPEEIQLARTMQRDQLSEQAVMAIIKQQASREQRLQMADDVIVNNASLEKLQDQIMLLNGFYQQLAKEKCLN